MNLSNAHAALLSFLVAMVAAAPVAENKVSLEQPVSVTGDNAEVARAKRTKEEISFGNQQNGARQSMNKKSIPAAFEMPGQGINPIMDNSAQNLDSLKNADKAGVVYASEERRVTTEPKSPARDSEMNHSGDDGLGSSGDILAPSGAITSENKPEPEAELPSAPHVDIEMPQPEAPAEPEVPALTRLPENSQSADAEEGLHLEVQAPEADMSENDVESLLKELHGEERQSAAAETQEKSETRVQEDQKADGSDNTQVTPNDIANYNEYTDRLLNYILLSGDRIPTQSPYLYPSTYSFPLSYRHRRSLNPRSSVPHILNRHAGKQLARAKRTKRDLFDDDLYYKPEDEYQPLTSSEEALEEEEQKDADLKELVSYLLALSPYEESLQSKPQSPGYYWYGPSYPEESYPAPELAIPEWEEPDPVYELPERWESQAPVWQQVFYPREVDEESYYPTPVKRQMMSMVPGQRRKRYFFPFAREPYTHWGAFVPSQEKRDFEDAYRRLRELSLLLADSRRPPSYLDALKDYRKK